MTEAAGRRRLPRVLAVGSAIAAAFPLAASAEDPMEEIIVTANRRAENVQDVASGIRVLAGEELERLGADSFEDYIYTVPGADVGEAGGAKKIALRGVSNVSSALEGAGGSTSPVGIYFGDIPIQGSGVLPDLALYDLERIEVLKGPQGTLYGEGAMGGAIRMLPTPASPDGFSVKGELGVGQTKNGSGLDHFLKAALNVPVFGTWSARLVGSRRVEQGFVDFIDRGTRGEDDATNLMGRVHVDGEMTDDLAVAALFMHQRQRLDQLSQVQVTEGDLQNHDSEPQFLDVDFTLAGLVTKYDFGFAGLTSSTSWFESQRQALFRFVFIPATVFAITDPIVPGIAPDVEADNEWFETKNMQSAIAQELRLVSGGDGWLQWIVGGFYRVRTNDFDFLIDNDVSDEPPPVGPGIVEVFGTEKFEQFAGFGEGTVRLPWNTELDLGLRGFRETVDLDGVAQFRGPLFPLDEGDLDGTAGSFGIATTAVTPKVSLTWHADDQRMVYTTVAKGTRSGGTNYNALHSEGITPIFRPDSLWSYEVGAKTQWFDGLFTANLALFYIDWKDLQVQSTETGRHRGVFSGVNVVTLNVASAFTRGVELELVWRPADEALLGFSAFTGEGEIEKGDPRGAIPDGTRVPQLAALSYAAFADYEVSRWTVADFAPFLHFDTQSVSDRILFPPNGLTEGVAPGTEGFQTFNTLIGLASDRWQVTFGVRNLTDARPELGVNPLELDSKTVGRPRAFTGTVAFAF